ncbi:MAG: lysine--tRNA ligase [Candidatus Kaiserbacteria bacterium]|nr:lysine--tRNA ligase [Candidatus Kaiserbacteria bacterium]
MSEADIRGDRIRKLEALKAAGMDPYPPRTERGIAIDSFASRFAELESGKTSVTVAGRLMALRGQGGIMFGDLYDGTGRMQIVLQKDDMDAAHFDLFSSAVDTGDFLEASGIAYTTKRGEKSLKVSKWTMLSKSLLPIPDEWYGLKDEEKVLRERYLDILLNEEVRAMFVRRSRFWNSMRYFLIERGFLEVETPVLETTPGGADARPFITHHNALDIEVYLRISCGELWQKRLMIAGFPSVFEIGRIFRNEGQSREHLQDYTQMEFYQAYADYRSGIELVKELYRYVVKETYGKYSFTINGHEVDFAEEWQVIDFSEMIRKNYDLDPLTCSEQEAIVAASKAGVLTGETEHNKARAVDNLWKRLRRNIAGPAFLTGVPVYLEPLAKRNPEDPRVVERFQVILAGSEMGKGYSELNDPLDQRARFEEQQRMRDQGDDEAQRLDTEYVRAMEYGMPPAVGFGVSERLFSFLENRPAHEAQLFPLLRPKSE